MTNAKKTCNCKNKRLLTMKETMIVNCIDLVDGLCNAVFWIISIFYVLKSNALGALHPIHAPLFMLWAIAMVGCVFIPDRNEVKAKILADSDK